MTDNEVTIIILHLIIILMLLIMAFSMPFKTDKETKELLKQICNNTRDKTIPVKPVNVTVGKARVTKFATCPCCSQLITNRTKHCENCGAEIDWSDTE